MAGGWDASTSMSISNHIIIVVWYAQPIGAARARLIIIATLITERMEIYRKKEGTSTDIAYTPNRCCLPLPNAQLIDNISRNYFYKTLVIDLWHG